MTQDKLTVKAQEALAAAQERASSAGPPELTGLHVLAALLDNIDFFKYPKRKDFIRYHNTIKMSGIEYLILSDICVYDINHTTFDENLEVPEYLAFNRVILPMDKQMNEKYNTPPIKLR